MAVATLLHAGFAGGQVVVYEGEGLPETLGWEHELAGTPGAERQLIGGWLVVTADLPEGWNEPTGDADFYRLSLTEFAGASAFFIDWRVVTDAPGELLDVWALPVGVAAGGNGPLYHTTITASRARFLRDLTLPIVFVALEPTVPHTYRLEVLGNTSYSWYIDGALVESGVPAAPYPDPSATFVWGVRRWYVDATTAWDFVRVGRIPEDGSGDYDSDGALTEFDYYFVHDCLTKDGPGTFGGPGGKAGPGCRFADFDAESDADLLDFAEFANHFTGSD